MGIAAVYNEFLWDPAPISKTIRLQSAECANILRISAFLVVR